METQPDAQHGKFISTSIPKRLSREDFNRYIAPSLKTPQKGPTAKTLTRQNLQLSPAWTPHRHSVE